MSLEWRSLFSKNSYVPPTKERLKISGTTSVCYAVQLIACDIPQTIFFHTTLTDGAVMLLVEVVQRRSALVNRDDDSEDELDGWLVIRIHQANRNLTDFSQQTKAPIWSFSGELCAGSPKLLWFLDASDGNVKHVKSKGQLNFALQTHRLLARAIDYLPENTILDAQDVVPGLELMKNGCSLANPVPKPPAPGFLDDLTVRLGPQAERMEADLCFLINRERRLMENKPANANKGQDGMVILERRVRIGVHNGWTFIQDPVVFHLSADSGSGTQSLGKKGPTSKKERRTHSWDRRSVGQTFYLRNRVELNSLVADGGMAVVFTLEYVLGFSSNMANAASQPVCICWGAWSPFSERVSGILEVTVPLLGGTSPNPESLLCFKNLYKFLASSSSMQTGKTAQIFSNVAVTFRFGMLIDSASNPDLTTSSVQQFQSPVPEKPTLTGNMEAAAQEGSPGEESMKPEIPKPPSRKDRPPLREQLAETQVKVTQLTVAPPAVPGPTFQDWTALQRQNKPYGTVPASIPVGLLSSMTEMPDMLSTTQPLVLTFYQQPAGVAAIPRATLAMLNQAGFPNILDRFGNSADMVDIQNSTPLPNVEQELEDPLGCNEIVFQFLALACPAGRSTNASLPRNVFFTFQFYRFPLVSTERLLLSVPENLSDCPTAPRILRRLDRVGNLVLVDPGYQVKFMVDPMYLKPGEDKAFLQYIRSHCAHIDVWDADSLMLLGSSVLPLKQLSRRGKEGVQAYCQLPVVITEMRSTASDDAGEDTAPSTIRAFIYLKMANIGYPHSKHRTADPTVLSRNPAVISHRLHKPGVTAAEPYRARGRPLAMQNTIVTVGKRLETVDTETNEERKRKLHRLATLREIERSLTVKTDNSSTEIMQKELESYRRLRQENKQKTLLAAVLQSITTVHTVFPSFGACEFMEFLVENPFNDAVTVTVDISDPDLKVITDPHEWQFFKRAYSLHTPMEVGMFLVNEKPFRNSTPQLFLKPKERLYVPFKYQTFACMQQSFAESKNDKNEWIGQIARRTVMLEAKTVKAAFKRSVTEELISVLFLQVEPQPIVVHHTFRFYHPENSFLTKYLRLNSLDLQGFAPRGFQGIQCSDPTVICQLRSEPNAGPQDVYLKVGCGSSPQVKSFWVMLYADAYLSTPVQTWHVNVHACQKIDLNTLQGQTTRFPLVLKGGQANRMLRCFPSSPSELVMQPTDPFLLQAGAVAEITANFTPLLSGDRTLQVTAVDLELQQLVKSWLICAVVRSSNVSKAYQVTIPIGEHTINKRISYKNAYGVAKRFLLSTNRPEVVSFKENVLHLDGQAEGAISVKFAAARSAHTADALVFVNDDDGNSEDSFALKIAYVQP